MITTEFETQQAYKAVSLVGDTKILTRVEEHPGLELRHYQALAETNPMLLKKYQMLGWLMNRGATAVGASEAKAAAVEWAETKDFDGCWVRIREEGDDLPVERASVVEDRYDMTSLVAPLKDLVISDESASGLLVATPILIGKDGEPGIHTPPIDLYIAGKFTPVV